MTLIAGEIQPGKTNGVENLRIKIDLPCRQLCRHHRQWTIGVELIHIEIKLMHRAVVTGLIFAAYAPAAEVEACLAISAQGAVILVHIKLAGILAGEAIVEQKSADPLVPALRRRPVWIVIFHPRLRNGDIQHPGVVTERGARKAEEVITIGKRLRDLLLGFFF